MAREKISELVQSHSFLPQIPAREQIHWMLDRPDADAFIEAQDPVVLLRVMEEAGWEEASALVPYISPWQLQVFLDFDVWRKDRFVSQKLIRWFETALELADDQKFKRFCRETDAEMLALLFQEHLMVGLFDEDGDPPPEFNAYDWSNSPDGIYAIVFPEDEEMSVLLRNMINRLYEVDRVMGWTLLEAARWELHSNMEEEAYRWRNSRLEEFGFVSREEAMDIYRPIDPVKLRDKGYQDIEHKRLDKIGKTTLPALFDPSQTGNFYILQILDALPEDELALLFNELIAVQNRALLADGVEPSNAAIAREITERTLGYMSVGLEFLARGDDDEAEAWISNLAMREIFRVGFSLVSRLQRTARELEKRPTLTILEGERFSLLNEDERAFFEGISRPRPVLQDPEGFRNFERQADIDSAAGRLALIAFKQIWTFGIEKFEAASIAELATTCANPATELGFDLLFRTRVANELLKQPSYTPLNATKLAELARLINERVQNDDSFEYFKEMMADTVVAVGPNAARPISAWISASITRLTEEIGSVMNPDPALLGEVVLLEA